jgi:hypothetical protein
MDPLWLDYRRSRSGSTVPGLVLLAASLVCTVWLLETYAGLRTSIDAAEQRLFALELAKEKGQAQAPQEATRTGYAPPTAPVAGREWVRLLAGIEAPIDETVTLLGVEPNDKEREVILTGETPNLAALAAFMERLGDGGVLKQVRLLSHEVVREHPAKPLRFVLVLTWRPL